MRVASRLLVLHAQYTTRLSYFDDWLHAFRTYPSFDVVDIDIASSDITPKLQLGIVQRRTPLSCSIPQMVTRRNIWSRLLQFSLIVEYRCFHSSAMKLICPDHRSRRNGGYLAKSGPTGSPPKCLRRRAGSYSVTWSRGRSFNRTGLTRMPFDRERPSTIDPSILARVCRATRLILAMTIVFV